MKIIDKKKLTWEISAQNGLAAPHRLPIRWGSALVRNLTPDSKKSVLRHGLLPVPIQAQILIPKKILTN
jgi:lipopolysaccharide export system protein LptC